MQGLPIWKYYSDGSYKPARQGESRDERRRTILADAGARVRHATQARHLQASKLASLAHQLCDGSRTAAVGWLGKAVVMGRDALRRRRRFLPQPVQRQSCEATSALHVGSMHA